MHPILVLADDLCEKKSDDYNRGQAVDHSHEEYFPYGYKSYLHMIHTKVKRLEAVLLSPNSEVTNFESALDSVLDLINYSSFLGAYIRDNEKADKK